MRRRSGPGGDLTFPKGPVRGTSLVETMVAFSLLALTTVVVFGLFRTLHQAHSTAEGRTAAAFQARSLLDQAEAADFAALARASGTLSHPGTRNGQPVVREFRWVRDVQALSESTRLVWVTLTWREGPVDSTLVMETVVSRH